MRIQNMIGKYFFKHGIRLKNNEGVLFQLPANDWITRIMLMEGGYEKDSVALAAGLMKNGGTFIDIGANFGLYSCTVGAMNRSVKIVAADPNYKIIPLLLANIRLNKTEQQTAVFTTAIAHAATFVTMEQPAADNMGTTQTKQGGTRLLNVPACSLQQLLEANDIETAVLIKIDIEGNEFGVFEHFDFKRYFIGNIILEFNHLSPVSFETLLRFFQQNGFIALDVHGAPVTGETEIWENNIWFKNSSKSH